MECEEPPADLVARAKTKLEAVKAAGEIAFFFIYETRLKRVWAALRAANDEDPSRQVIVTLAAGAPALDGIRIEAPITEKGVASLTVEVQKEVALSWRYEWFKLGVIRRLREAGIKDHINNAQVYGAYVRARAGEKVHQLQLGVTPVTGSVASVGKAFSVIANKQRHEIGVAIRNVSELRVKENRDAMLSLINQAVKHMTTDDIEYRVLKKDFLEALQGAIDGPEGLGLELPLVLLAAAGHPAGERRRPAGPAHHPGAGRIGFDVSKDKLEATITGFQEGYYDDPSFQVSTEWVQNELRRCHIVAAMAPDVLKGLADAIVRKEDLNGMLACRGQAGAPAQGPYLFEAYRDAAMRTAGNLEDGLLDIRELQQRSTVVAGQLIAEIRYETPAVPGYDVYGDEIAPAASDKLDVRMGEGVETRESGGYYATTDGIPTIDKHSISLSKVLVHEGDVNLRSGNIRFDGPVEIKGSIDSGAVVETTGDLTVHGQIRGAFVKTQGNLTVLGGVTTGNAGAVQCKGDFAAEFVENSSIVCGGTVRVKKALLSSTVIGGGEVIVEMAGGVLAGGRIICKDSLRTKNLGFKRGAVTVLNVGVDWRVARSIEIKRDRIVRFDKRLQDDRLVLRELIQKTKAQMTARHREMKDELQSRLVRLRAVIERLEAQVAQKTAVLTYNADARVDVTETLAANVNLTLGGQQIAVTMDVASVAVLSKRRRGSHILPLETLEKEDQEAGRKAG